DAPDAWPDRLELDGFEYQHLGGSGGDTAVDVPTRGTAWFEGWLRKTRPYRPQPYEQLAGVFRQMGYHSEASARLYAGRERGRSRTWSEGDYARWFGETLLMVTIGYGYGYRYFRSLLWVVLLVLVGVAVLRITGQHRVPGEPGQRPMTLGAAYALDMLLPF